MAQVHESDDGLAPVATGDAIDGESIEQPGEATARDPRGIRETTRILVNAVLLDVWPSNATIVDFGLDSQEHLEALYYPLRQGDITPEQLDGALGNGEKLTALAQGAASNPHKDIVFRPSWDRIVAWPQPEEDSHATEVPPAPDNALTKGTYEVWHDSGWPMSRIEQTIGGWPPSSFPEDYIHAANVQADSLEHAVALTTDTGDFISEDAHPQWEPWTRKDGVQSLVEPPSVRDTGIGDVIVGPEGKVFRFERDGFMQIGRSPASGQAPGDIAEDNTLSAPSPDLGRDNGRGR